MTETGSTVSEQNGRKLTLTSILAIVNLLLLLIGGAMAWQHSRDQASVVETRLLSLETNVKTMAEFGHPDHERRITKLELIKADATALVVTNLANQIDKLADVVRTDHDSVVTLKTMVDEARKR